MEINVNKPIQVQQKTGTGWKKEPSISDLKTDLNNSVAAHSAQVSKITKWLDALYLTGSAKPKTAEGKSKVAPKLVRTQAEWRYSALSEVFLSSADLFKASKYLRFT